MSTVKFVYCQFPRCGKYAKVGRFCYNHIAIGYLKKLFGVKHLLKAKNVERKSTQPVHPQSGNATEARCPKCGKQLSFRLANKQAKIRCPVCKNEFIYPIPEIDKYCPFQGCGWPATKGIYCDRHAPKDVRDRLTAEHERLVAEAKVEPLKKIAKNNSTDSRVAVEHSIKNKSHLEKGGSNWYYTEDKVRCFRQVVLTSEPKRAVKSRFGSLMLPHSFIELVRHPLVIGLFPMSGHPEKFLLVRTDNMVKEVAKSTLQVAFSFFHLPTSGLVAIYVSCTPLKEKCKNGFLEQIYGLDSELTRDLVERAVKGEALHIIHAGGGGMRTKMIIIGSEESGDMDGPLCQFDIDIPYENNCKLVLAEEWDAVLRHHRSIRNPDFQAAGQRLYELMPQNVNPILPAH